MALVGRGITLAPLLPLALGLCVLICVIEASIIGLTIEEPSIPRVPHSTHSSLVAIAPHPPVNICCLVVPWIVYVPLVVPVVCTVQGGGKRGWR